MENVDKIVEYVLFCHRCKHLGKNQYEEPCNACLSNPSNVNSRKPVNFELDEEAEKKLNKNK